MEEKIEFIRLWQTQKHTVKDLCQSFGISRTTAYKYIKQFEQTGYEGLLERSRKPHRYHNQTPEYIELDIVKLKKKYKYVETPVSFNLFKHKYIYSPPHTTTSETQ